VGLYTIVYMVKFMDFKVYSYKQDSGTDWYFVPLDDLVYWGWTSLFLMFYMLFSGGVSMLASAVFVT